MVRLGQFSKPASLCESGSPAPGSLKQDIPAEALSPLPVKTTTRCAAVACSSSARSCSLPSAFCGLGRRRFRASLAALARLD